MARDSLVVRLPNCGTAPAVAEACSQLPYPFFLDSGMKDDSLGRFSFVGCDPFLTMRASGRSVDVLKGGKWKRLHADPFDVLQQLLDRYTVNANQESFPFMGGGVGYLGYNLGRIIERLPEKSANDLGLPDAVLCFYDALIVFDHGAGDAFLVSSGLPELDEIRRLKRAHQRLDWLRAIASRARTEGRHDASQGPSSDTTNFGGTFTRKAYVEAVERVRDYIIAGDCYQVNLSQRFQAPCSVAPWDLYLCLRSLNPAPFAAYQDFGEFSVLSASPERFLRRSGATIETRPIKGTRPRGSTPTNDKLLELELVASSKDRAEHVMIVDLERSDLGRVAEVGTVTVDEMMTLERYATVHHLTSTIRGQLRRDCNVADLLRATFPGGSITGAPKIRAMEIIDQIEPTQRGVYTGAIGYFSWTGDLDLNVAIRTIVLKEASAYFHVGGGIVFDSDPDAEYQETLDKGQALFQALSLCGFRDEIGSVA